DEMASYVAKKTVQSIIKSGQNIASSKVLIMGCTFKEDVSDIRNSKVADVIQELKDYQVQVDVIDPHANNEEVQHEYGFELSRDTNGQYDAIIVAVNHEPYMQKSESYFSELLKPNGLLVDVKGIYRNKIKQLNYWSL